MEVEAAGSYGGGGDAGGEGDGGTGIITSKVVGRHQSELVIQPSPIPSGVIHVQHLNHISLFKLHLVLIRRGVIVQCCRQGLNLNLNLKSQK